MLFPNAAITTYGQRTGARGDGRASLVGLDVAALPGGRIPCEVAEPSFQMRQTAQSIGVEATRIVRVERPWLARLDATPAVPGVGDRFTISYAGQAGLVHADETLVVNAVHGNAFAASHLAGAEQVVTLLCSPAKDGQTIPDPEEA